MSEVGDEIIKGLKEVIEYQKGERSLKKTEWVELKHAHWFTTATGWIYCSNCDREPPNETNYRSDYCPNCGAKMDEEVNGNN